MFKDFITTVVASIVAVSGAVADTTGQLTEKLGDRLFPSETSVSYARVPEHPVQPPMGAVRGESTSTPSTTTVITQPVIERVVETVRTVDAGGVTSADLDARLAALTQDFTRRLQHGADTSLRQDEIISDSIGDTFADATITGGSLANYLPLTGGTLTGDLSLSGTLTAGSLSVAGLSSGSAITIPYLTATSTTATSTFAAGIQTSALNVTSSSASSTFANGINISAGCFAVSGTCLPAGTGTVGSGTQGQFAFYNGVGTTLTATSSLFISQAGNVGIGTTTPPSTLDVNGTLGLPHTTSVTSGVVNLGGTRFLHTYTDPLNLALTGAIGDPGNQGRNIFMGVEAGNFTMGPGGATPSTLGARNIGIGHSALKNNTTGWQNTAIGYISQRSVTSGQYNTALGAFTLVENTTGNNNTAIGADALWLSTTGSSNTAVGTYAMQQNTTGSTNTAVGREALRNNQTGNNSVAIGHEALPASTVSNNVAVGTFALRLNTIGANNLAVGNDVLRTNIEGDNNTGVGIGALYFTTADNNTAVGFAAGDDITTGGSNTLVGFRAGDLLSTGASNTLLGNRAGDNLTTGSGNIVVGSNIDSPIATNSNTLTIGNLIFGTGLDGTGTMLSTGNIGIGTTTPWRKLSVAGTVGFDGLTGSTGAGSLCLDSNKQVVYNSGSDSCLSSTRDTKHDITPLSLDDLGIISALEPVSFVYTAGDGRERYGFIAEDAAAVDAHFATYDASGAISGIDDRSILAAIVGAVKDLWSKVAALMQSDDEQNARIQQLEADIAALRSHSTAAGASSGEQPEAIGGTSTSSPSADDASIPPNSDTGTTTSATTTAATSAAANDEEPETSAEPAADDQAPELPEVQHAEPTPAADPITAEADTDTSLSETAELPTQ